ncbi:MAG: DUF433 domain-containing protein [Gammaproteobacteria bacterium]|nr:DUF433 domain-containing protein [Gammaproteobacteria bacterium]
MTRQKKTRLNDLRGLPAYSIAEAAHYLSVPAATTRYWATGQGPYPALIDVPDNHPTLLSFLNLVELHVLAAIRRKHTVPMPKVRAAIEYLREHTRSAAGRQHPLISKQLETDGLDLFVERYGELVNISKAGQMAMREVMSAALHRIERDPRGIPIKLYPFTRSRIDDAPAMVVIDPALSAGRPVIAGTGLATEVIADRYKAGESVNELAKDYERKKAEIEEAIRCELKAAA